MAELQTDPTRDIPKHGGDDIDSKIADFMADIDEIVLGKKPTDHQNGASEWKQCFDETLQSIYYWNTKTNECSWTAPTPDEPTPSTNHDHAESQSTNPFVDLDRRDRSAPGKKRLPAGRDHQSPKKFKKPSLIAEYASSESESTDDGDDEDDIDELLNEVLEKEEKVESKPAHLDSYPSFEMDYRSVIERLAVLESNTTECVTLRIQLETRLEDCLAGHLSKSYAVRKLEEALRRIEDVEKAHSIPEPLPVHHQPLTNSEVALLLSLPPPPPPPSPPPITSPSDDDHQALQLFYAQLNYEEAEPPPPPSSSSPEVEKKAAITRSDYSHHHHKDKKTKPSKNLPTDLIQKWTHARQELHGVDDMDPS